MSLMEYLLQWVKQVVIHLLLSLNKMLDLRVVGGAYVAFKK